MSRKPLNVSVALFPESLHSLSIDDNTALLALDLYHSILLRHLTAQCIRAVISRCFPDVKLPTYDKANRLIGQSNWSTI